MRHLFQSLPYNTDEIEQLVLTTPVASFENYLAWLNETLGDLAGDKTCLERGRKVRIVDESTAAAEGALQVALGFGLDDYLIHSYGLRHLDSETDAHQYDEIIPMGSPYPTEKPVEALLSAAHPQQEAVEFIIGEIDTDAAAMVEVKYEDGQAVFVAQADQRAAQIVPLNKDDAGRLLARLLPPGSPGETRLKAAFTVDERRQLRLTVSDLKTEQELLSDVAVVTLR